MFEKDGLVILHPRHVVFSSATGAIPDPPRR